MRYLTPRKRAERRGSARSGTEDHWYMTVSAVALAFLIPTCMIIFGRALGGTREEVIAAFSHPFAAILTALVLFVSMNHFWRGAAMMLQDYTKGSVLKGLIILAISVSYLIMAVGFFALARMAL